LWLLKGSGHLGLSVVWSRAPAKASLGRRLGSHVGKYGACKLRVQFRRLYALSQSPRIECGAIRLGAPSIDPNCLAANEFRLAPTGGVLAVEVADRLVVSLAVELTHLNTIAGFRRLDRLLATV